MPDGEAHGTRMVVYNGTLAFPPSENFVWSKCWLVKCSVCGKAVRRIFFILSLYLISLSEYLPTRSKEGSVGVWVLFFNSKDTFMENVTVSADPVQNGATTLAHILESRHNSIIKWPVSNTHTDCLCHPEQVRGSLSHTDSHCSPKTLRVPLFKK